LTALQLQRLLDRAGMTQRGAAKELDISERQMRRYYAGVAKVPRTVELACKYLWEKPNGKD
jgi:predicted DNA-binding protein (UPF0251 family)